VQAYVHGINADGIPFQAIQISLNAYSVQEGAGEFKTMTAVDTMKWLLDIQFGLEGSLSPDYERFKNQLTG